MTFLFLFLSSFHLCQAQVVWRVLPRSPALQCLLLAVIACPPSSFLLPWASAASSFNPRDWYRDGSDEVHHGNMMMDIKLEACFFCKVWSRHLSLPPSASAPDLFTHPLSVDGLEMKLPLPVGPAVARHLEWLPLTCCCSSYDITFIGSASSLPGHIGAGGALRYHSLFMGPWQLKEKSLSKCLEYRGKTWRR